MFGIIVKQSRERHSSLAQSVEHSAVNRVVVGSSPTGGATKKDALLCVFFLLFKTTTRLTDEGC